MTERRDIPIDGPSIPEVSIVIPVFDEERILRAAALDLAARLVRMELSAEIVLAENGSRDSTLRIAHELAHELALPPLRVVSVDAPNYGAALRAGIEAARGTFVVCEEIDLCDTAFLARAIELLRDGDVDFVIGSKLMPTARDRRPAFRHVASVVYSRLLRATVGLRGSDTHGLKAFRRAVVLPIVRACVVDKDVFASELVIRAERADIRMRDIPVSLAERRPPSIDLVRRVPDVLSRVGRLWWALR
jgi:glycosyltransferase involved in cell wall biosynthesis